MQAQPGLVFRAPWAFPPSFLVLPKGADVSQGTPRCHGKREGSKPPGPRPLTPLGPSTTAQVWSRGGSAHRASKAHLAPAVPSYRVGSAGFSCSSSLARPPFSQVPLLVAVGSGRGGTAAVTLWPPSAWPGPSCWSVLTGGSRFRASLAPIWGIWEMKELTTSSFLKSRGL